MCRANILAIPAGDPELEAKLKASGWRGPLWRLHRKMEIPPIDGPVAAFCGIARPNQFFDGLEAAGLHLVSRIAFPDHHRCTATDLGRILSAARGAGAAALLTTEKDRVRLGKLAEAFSGSPRLETVSLRIEIENESSVIALLAEGFQNQPKPIQ